MKRAAIVARLAYSCSSRSAARRRHLTFRQLPLPGDRPAANPHSTRSVVLGRNGMIATSQPLASAAGLKVLQDGGNAIDAAITAAAVLAVVEPTMNGVGGDLFAIVYDAKTKKLHGLNSSGRAGHTATLDAFASRKLTRIPNAGVYSVTVPGVVDGWSTLLAAHGTIPLAKALQPAIGYAKNGYAVSEIIARQWEGTERKLSADPAAAATFLPGGHAPKPGDIFSNPNLARTLETIATGGRDAFYKGSIAARDCRRHEEARRLARRDRFRGDTKPTGSIRSRRAIAATTCSSCRRTRRDSSSSR